MGIKFTCPACGGTLNVKAELAGKRGRCPKCQAKINIPLDGNPPDGTAGDSVAGASAAIVSEVAIAAPLANPAETGATPVPTAVVAAAAAAPQPAIVPMPAANVAGGAVDPIAEAPALQWYATPPGAASQYGPAGGEEFRAWMQEGRITADALVWRQDWPDWKRAGEVFPQLESPPAAGGAPVVAAPPVAAAVMAAPVMVAGTMPLPTAPTAMPMMPGGPPVAQPAFPMAPGAPGPFPAAAPVPSDAFPITADEPAAKRSGAGRGR
ncbi:MAG TPA: GYF domain-containing protein, partial [Pirellulales bacterium]